MGVECLVTPDVDLDLVNITLGGALAPILDDLARQVRLHPRPIRHETIRSNVVAVDRVEVEAIGSELDFLLPAAVSICPDENCDLLVSAGAQVDIGYDERILSAVQTDHSGVPTVVEVVLERGVNHLDHQRTFFVSM